MPGMRPRVLAIAAALLIVVGVAVFVLVNRAPEPVPEAPVQPAAPVGVQKSVIGTSVQGRSIEAYAFGNGPTHLLFVGGIHGGYEWNSVLLAYQFIDYFTANPSLIATSTTVTIVPSANPDGVFKVIGKEGRFAITDVPAGVDQSLGRFNANGVDLNRNFDCKWQPKSTWRSKEVSAGTAPFSEPEAAAIRDLVAKQKPSAAIFWHSQANAVYASECEQGILPQTLTIMNAYAQAAGYKAVSTFDAYPVTGDVEGWLASIGVPAITVELATHETVEWEKNLAGVKALLNIYSK